MSGYSLAVGIEGHHAKVYHIDFPIIRRVIDLVLWAAALIEVCLFAIGHKLARAFGWTVFLAAVGVGIWDIIFYGTIGAPMRASALLLLLLLALAAHFRSRLC